MKPVTNDSLMSQFLMLREEVGALRSDLAAVERRMTELDGGKPKNRNGHSRQLCDLRHRLNDVLSRVSRLENKGEKCQ